MSERIASVRIDRIRVHCNAQIEQIKNTEPTSDGSRHLAKIKAQIYGEILRIVDGETA